MPVVNPLLQGSDGLGVMNGSFDTGSTMRRQPDSGGSPPVGSGAVNADHNLPMHCAGMILIALAVIFAFQWMGFRFAFDVGMGRS